MQRSEAVIDRTWNGDPVPDVETARVELELGDDLLRIRVDAPFWDDPPPNAPPGPVDALWEHEVVEVFVANGDRYLEVELGPRGHHLVLRLDGVRNAVERAMPIAYQAAIAGGRWTGDAVVPRAWLPPGPWTWNAYAIHGTTERRYLAATPLPGERPDFHQPGRFVLRLG